MKRAPLTEAEQAEIEVNRNRLVGIIYAICAPWVIGYGLLLLIDYLISLDQ